MTNQGTGSSSAYRVKSVVYGPPLLEHTTLRNLLLRYYGISRVLQYNRTYIATECLKYIIEHGHNIDINQVHDSTSQWHFLEIAESIAI